MNSRSFVTRKTLADKKEPVGTYLLRHRVRYNKVDESALRQRAPIFVDARYPLAFAVDIPKTSTFKTPSVGSYCWVLGLSDPRGG